jgi:hypothetical protein
MTTKTIDLQLKLKPEQATAGAQKVTRSLKDIQDQANKTRESMAKMTEVAGKLALVGGAILAPFALAMNKYVATVKETEPVSKRITELSKKWEESQVRLGRVTATIVLPALEKGAEILESVISFAEKNPGVVQAALTIGTTLVVLGGLIATTAQLVQTVATIQGLAAGAGIALGGGGAAAGAVGGAGLAGIIASGIGLAVPVLVTAIGAVIGGNIGLGIGNALAGTNKTWADIGETARKLLIIVQVAWLDRIPKLIASGLQALGAYIGNGIRAVVDAIGAWFRGGQASGGYANLPGFYARAEQGREFVLNASTTRNAERAIGGRLSQGSAMASVTNNLQVGNGMTIAQTRRMVRANERAIMGSLAGAFS